MAMAGAGGLAIGTGVVSSILAAAKAYADVGSELNDMSARTGVATEALSVLKFAAQQTGTDMAGVETGVRKMQKAIFAAGSGSEEAAKSLAALGLSAEQLQGMSADRQMGLIADRLLGIPDAGDRAAVAMQVFGKSGTALLPMLAGGSDGIRQFATQARQLGVVMDQQTAARADALGDAIDALRASMLGAFVQVGGAAAPILTQLAGNMSSMASAAGQFVAENGELTVTLLKASAALTAVSGTAVVAGAAIGGLGTVFGGLRAAFTMLGGLGALFSPVGLAVGGVTAAVAGVGLAARQLSPDFRAATDALLGFNAAQETGAAEAAAAAEANAEAQRAAAREAVEAAQEAAEAARVQREAEERLAAARKKLESRGLQIRDQVATPEEQLRSQIAELRQLREANAIDAQTFTRAVDAAKASAVDAMIRKGGDVKTARDGMTSAGTFGGVDAIGIGPELARLEDPMLQIERNTAATVDAIARAAIGEGAVTGIAATPAPPQMPADLLPGEFQAQLDAIAEAAATGGDIAGAAGRASAEFRASMGAPPAASLTATPIGTETAAPRAVATQAAADAGTQTASQMAALAASVNTMSAKLVAAIGHTTEAIVATGKVLR
ncbi:MAG: phage tail tape measure protein, partial [Caulobacteraceae bacterium]|nr:phage tail tape measure protein [Caulobacteraceae bacterium]